MVHVARRTIGFGDYGSLATLGAMRDMINRSLSIPLVVETAHGIVSTVPARDYLGMAQAIRAWLARVFKFVPDPVGVELLRDPDYQLRQYMTSGRITGDCDDVAVLGLALAKAVGIAGRLVAVGFRPGGPLVHVYAVLTGPPGRGKFGLGPNGVDLDVTRPAGTNLRPVRYVEHVV